MRDQEYKDFSLRVHEKGGRRPIVGQFELTHRCNLSCQHCYIVNDPKRQELTGEEWRHIIDEVHREGCLWLCFTGGEPLLREDFLDIYFYAYKKGFIITLFTSATLLNEETAKCLRMFPPFCIEVTLNGVTKKTYELITQVPGSFERVMQGIELIRKYNLPLKLKCQAMTLNFHEIPLVRRFYQEMGMKFRCSILINPRMDGLTEPCSLRLPMENVLELEGRREVIKGRDEIEDNFEEKAMVEKENEALAPSDNLFRCPGGTWAFYVNPFGELFFCSSVRKPSWDLRRHSFRRGFYEFFSRIRSRKFNTDSECRTCQLRYCCRSCPGKAELECGDPEAAVPYHCQLAKLTKSRRSY